MNKTVKLRDIASFSQGIQIPIKKQLSEKLEGAVRFIRIVDYTKLGNEPPRYIPNPGKNYIVEEDDIVMIRYGSKTAGMVSSGVSGAIANNMFQIKIKEKNIVDKNFLYWTLRQEGVYKSLNNSQSSSTMPAITFDMIGNLIINIPDLVNQKKITSILSAYNHLIENNTRRIQILEEMAQRIYKEWFVDFKYPGYENDELVDSELGMIPEEWEVKSVEQISIVNRGRSYKSVEIKDGLPFINLKCINRQGGYRSDGLKKYSGMYKDSHVVKPNDIVIAVTDMTQDRAIVGRAARVPDEGIKEYIISMDLVSCIPNSDIQMEYLYGMYKYSNYGNQIKEFANGANVLHLLPARIKEFKFSLPPDSIRQKYSIEIQKFYELEDNLFNKNQNLRQTRDLLLPKLISGKIDVSELDIDTSILND